ncbi:type II toxin-antitoxin system HicB family antitoxin [Methanoculleus caldifontis]|uniref:type II toxin-antitoxin system HicB family antitoxin n=1 Tax=Methanoculleus caldifontis TaxID=2651577 RepID=UPI00293710B5|nr:type II toxin-antitoxin system HicB family antitoxin [Methanoculleus sp. Wushi-C6]
MNTPVTNSSRTPNPCYGEVPDLPGVWATGKTLEECRRNLAGVIDEWLILRLRCGLRIPPLAGA